MANNAVETFTVNTNWTCPAGVTQLDVVSRQRRQASIIDGSNTMGVLDPYGNAFLAGDNLKGQVGNGAIIPVSTAVAVLGNISFIRISGTLSNDRVFGISTLGILYGMGNNVSGELGVGDVTARSSPVAVLGNLRFKHVYGSSQNTLAISTSGLAYGMGFNGVQGVLGTADNTARSSPVAVVGGFIFDRLDLNSQSVVGLTTAGVPVSWGSNANAQLGLGDQNNRSSPVAVLGNLTCQAIGFGQDGSILYTWFLTTAGALYMCGSNLKGQLGVGDVNQRSSPVAVLGLNTFKKVAATGNGGMIGLTTSGQLLAWGNNVDGELGLGDVASRSSPVAVLGLSGVTVADFKTVRGQQNGSGVSVYVITSTGAVYSMGKNTKGQLGVGDVASRSSPVAVVGGFLFQDLQTSALSASQNQSVWAYTFDGTLYSFGDNTNGQLGLGDTNARSSPVAVLGGIQANTADIITSTPLIVTPGTTYAINISKFQATFGTTNIGQKIDQVQLYYQQ